MQWQFPSKYNRVTALLVSLTRTIEFHINATYTGEVPVASHTVVKRPASVRTALPGIGIVMLGGAGEKKKWNKNEFNNIQ